MKNMIKVLIVDDEARFRETTRKLLNKRGFETLLAENGEAALAKLDLRPDVVILDINMPGLDGLATLAEITRLRPGLPVIMLTGHGSEPSAREALDNGAFDYLAKPCDIDILAARIKRAVDRNRVEPEAERTIGEVMIPLEEYTILHTGATVREAIEALRQSFQTKTATGRIMETGHRSVLVSDDGLRIIGLIAILDLLEAIMPAYLKAPKPSTADSVRYSPLFWSGMFSSGIEELSAMELGEIMSPAPITIEADRSLMEASFLMATEQQRRLLVTRAGRAVGVIREQELFFEMEAILGRSGPWE